MGEISPSKIRKTHCRADTGEKVMPVRLCLFYDPFLKRSQSVHMCYTKHSPIPLQPVPDDSRQPHQKNSTSFLLSSSLLKQDLLFYNRSYWNFQNFPYLLELRHSVSTFKPTFLAALRGKTTASTTDVCFWPHCVTAGATQKWYKSYVKLRSDSSVKVRPPLLTLSARKRRTSCAQLHVHERSSSQDALQNTDTISNYIHSFILIPRTWLHI